MKATIMLTVLLGSAAPIAAQTSTAPPITPLPALPATYDGGYRPDAVARQLATVEAGTKRGPFKPDWKSLAAFTVPEWFRDAKFGIFIHWGPYSVPGFASEWYSRNMYDKRSPAFTYHRNVFGAQDKFGYKDFIPQFKAERFDPAQWIALFQQAGARYVVPVGEHCDGFAMYASKMTPWNAAEMGPKRDVAGELMTAARAKGMHFGLSSHRAEHWWWYNEGRATGDVGDPRYAALYGPAAPRTLPADNPASEPDPAHLENWFPPDKPFLDDWLARTTEMVDKYQPEMIYLDWWTSAPAFEPYLRRLSAYYYNEAKRRGQGPAIAYKGENFPAGAALFDVERGKLDALRLLPWQTDTSVSIKSWGYAQDDNYRTPKSLIADMIDVVSKNGNLLLNVGPKADGTIPDEIQTVLRGMGAWLGTNGEAIYGTRPWKYFGEGPSVTVTGEKKENPNRTWSTADIRFTTKGDTLYALGLERPADGRVLVKTLYTGTPYLARPIAAVTLLGTAAPVRWEQTARGLAVTLPSDPGGTMPYALKLTFAGGR
ncbi:alpha-L-fucosidase [Sphingomonas montana]|uniref:alpha-L-fucosidase n=1 Tax=Sphingomonas montana TaxID=1843236 RepID=UPI001F0B67AE|nr:alpha-L-fucosidase [Sphingomonas montana]